MRALAEAGPRGLSEGALLDAVWGDGPPTTGVKALHVVISRLRSSTAPDVIARTPQGYRIALPVEEVDLWAARPVGLALAREGRFVEALEHLAVAADDDAVVEARLRCVASVHGVPDALAAYESYRADLAARLGIDPAPVLRDLHAELLRRDRPLRNGLRFDADSILGRDEDLRQIEALVRSAQVRVVSLVGPGGLGKTRLAHLIGHGAEQPVVHLVALASVAADDDVAISVAHALGVHGAAATGLGPATGRGSVVDRIVEAIGTVPSLLILDNCEQVVAGVADLVADLVRRTPALTVLTTTRAPLGLTAEHVYPVPQLSQADAVALFRERALAARPGVGLDEDEVAALVARLDGLPLALELAAAAVRSLSVADIASRLDDRFGLLRAGSPDAPDRHQSLLAVIEWSWNLLSADQRRALRRLSVVGADIGLDGATAVVGPDALVQISALAAQSLVVVEESAGQIRYRMLDTVREFGLAQLEAAGEREDAEACVGAWMVGLAAEVRCGLHSRGQIAQARRLRGEEAVALDVLLRGLEHSDVPAVAEVFAALVDLWTIDGSHLKIVNLATRVGEFLAAAPIPAEHADAARGSLLAVVSASMIFSGAPPASAVTRLRELSADADHDPASASIEVILAMVDHPERDQIAALEALAAQPDPDLIRVSSQWLSVAWENAGDLAKATVAARRALDVMSPEDGPWGLAVGQARAAALALQTGDHAEASALADQATDTLLAVGAVEDAAQMLTVQALVAVREGRYDDADRLLGEAEAHAPSPSVFGVGLALVCGRAEVLLARGRTAEGLAAYAAGVAELSWRATRERSTFGVPESGQIEPWLLLPEAAWLAAAVRAGAAGEMRSVRNGLLAKAEAILATEPTWLDYPALGSVLWAVGSWEVAVGKPDRGTALMALAHGLSMNRMLPSLDPAFVESPTDPTQIEVLRDHLARRSPAAVREAMGILLAGD